MFVVRDCVHIRAPMERCFLLSTNIELLQRTLGWRILTTSWSRRSGLVTAGDRVIWYGWRLGLPQIHESIITGYEAPTFLEDTMGRGRFRRFQHDLQFGEIDGHVLLTGSVRFSIPLGRAGRWVGRRFVLPRIIELLRERLDLLRLVAEGEDWKRYLRQDE